MSCAEFGGCRAAGGNCANSRPIEKRKWPEPIRHLYSCDECGHEWFGYKTCPECGSRHVGLETEPGEDIR